MRRKACALLMSAALGGSVVGCMSTDGRDASPHCGGSWGKSHGPMHVPGVAGPHGQGVPMAAPYNMAPPPNQYAARQMMGNSVPLDMVQINRGANAPGMSATPGGSMPFTPIPHGGVLTPPGVPFAPGIPAGPSVRPTNFQPGMGGGVINANVPPGADLSGGLMLAQLGGGPAGGPGGPGGQVRFSAQRTQIRFSRPTGMKVAWFAQGPDGKPAFSNIPLEAPARYNFPQGAIYRLKISNLEGRPGLEIYPTMEVVPCNPKTEAFLAHSAVPLEFTQDDFKQIAEGNYVTKVIYLPDPQFQDVAGSGTDEIVSTRLEPGADPIQEALRRGSILVILRMGNVDQEAPNTPPLTPTPVSPPPGPPAALNLPPGVMVPYPGFMPPGMMPPGGPRAGGPGANPGLPPGYPPPGFPPPGFPPQGAFPPAPPSGKGPNTTNAAPSDVLFPPAPSIFAQPPAGSAEPKIEQPAVAPLPPPVAPTPSVPEKIAAPKAAPPSVAAPLAPVPAANEGKKAPEVGVPVTPLPPVPNNEGKSPVEVVPQALAPLPPPVAPPTVPNASGAKNIDLVPPPVPALPPVPGAGNKVDVPMSALPPVPEQSNAKPSVPTLTPVSNPSLPSMPEIQGSPMVPAFPATPGTIRPASPTPGAPSSTPRMPMTNDAGQVR